MGNRHPNHRLVKSHRCYTVEEVAGLFGIHKNTVRNWVKNGLAPIDNKRPMLILGNDLVEFLQKRRTKNKQTCEPGELYCVRCRAPRPAAEDMAEYSPITEKFGNLVAICPDCDAIMNRRVSLAKIGEVSGNIDIMFPEDLRHMAKETYGEDYQNNPAFKEDFPDKSPKEVAAEEIAADQGGNKAKGPIDHEGFNWSTIKWEKAPSEEEKPTEEKPVLEVKRQVEEKEVGQPAPQPVPSPEAQTAGSQPSPQVKDIVQNREGPGQIIDRANPTVNSDFRQGASDNEKTQSS